MTDRQIIVEVLRKLKVNEETFWARLNRCANEMALYYKKLVKQDEIIVLPVVRTVLDTLRK